MVAFYLNSSLVTIGNSLESYIMLNFKIVTCKWLQMYSFPSMVIFFKLFLLKLLENYYNFDKNIRLGRDS